MNVKETSKSYNAQRAWLLNFGNGFVGAVAYHEMYQIIMEPEIMDLPCTPVYCHQVLVLRRHILPVVNMVSLLTDEYHPEAGKTGIVGITVFQRAPHAPLNYAAIHLASTPTSLLVTDQQASALPENSPRWNDLAVACFSYDRVRVPVLDLAYLYSPELREANLAAMLSAAA